MKPTNNRDVREADAVADVLASGRTQRMTAHEIAWMLAASIRNPRVRLCAAGPGGVGARMFNSSEAAFVLLWKGATAAFSDNNGTLPEDRHVAKDLIALAISVERAKDLTGQYYTPQVVNAVLGEGELLDEVFAIPVTVETEHKALDLLSKFLVERTLSDTLRTTFAGMSPNDTIANPLAVVDALQRRAREVTGLSVDPGGPVVVGGVDDFRPRGRHTRPTGRKFLDNLLGGGYAPGEAYCVSAVTSGGKTCLMANVAIDAVENDSAAAAEFGDLSILGHWYYFTYELRKDQLQDRMHAYGARVNFASFNAELSTAERPETLKAYEREPWVNSPGNELMGERERVRAFRRRLSGSGDRLVIVDYSGTNPGHGTGGIEEVNRYLQGEVSRGRRVAGFVIDYAGIVVSRYINRNGLDPKTTYHHLLSFGDEIRNRICVPLNCTGWVLNQLHGDAGRKPSGARQHHSATLGCHNFADNFDYGIQYGMYNGVTGLLSMHCSKHRSSSRNEDGVVARFDGRFGAFLDPDDDYTVDPGTGQIVRRDFLDQMPVGPVGRPAVRRPPVDPRTGV